MSDEPKVWANRIVGHEDVPPDQLLANPDNWCLHIAAQQDAVKGSLDELGWIDDVAELQEKWQVEARDIWQAGGDY